MERFFHPIDKGWDMSLQTSYIDEAFTPFSVGNQEI